MSVIEQELLTRSSLSSSLWHAEARSGISEAITSADAPIFGPERREISFEVSAILANQLWFRPALDNLLEFLSLGDNWNGYGERPIHEGAIKKAVAVLNAVCREGPAPQVVPTSDGGVQIEWEANQYEIEIEIPPVGPALILIVDPSGEEKEVSAGPNSEVWIHIRDRLTQFRGAVD